MNPVQEAILKHQDRMGGDGTCVQYCIDEIADSPDDDFIEYVTEKATVSVIKKEWANLNSKNKSKKRSGQMEMTLCGLPCPTSIAYRDDFIPGGFRTVLTQYASVYQLIQSFNDHADQKRAFDESHQEFKDLVDAAKERADGDLNKPLSMLSDDFFQEVG
jgi:hypothetical protein